ncbi:MAG TPA: cytochrome c oxidase subunit II [Steroidobacteraceae bacterium]
MNHSALEAGGPFAHEIARLFWIFAGIATVVYLIVIAVLVFSLRRKKRDGPAPPDGVPPGVLRAIGGALALTGVILVGWALADFFSNRALTTVPPEALRIRVTAHQWWWEVEYLDAIPQDRVTTANHLVIPTGKSVLLELRSRDVIHSFWVPSLNGKKDLMPGYTTQLALIAARAGQYRGECAEFCGYQHAHMSIDLTAATPEEFDAWLEGQRASAAEPADDMQRRGRDVFLGSTCRACHAIQGTIAAARLGPDLTHVASRPRIAAGAVPNDIGHLAAWITDPQSIKPGTKMPSTKLSGPDLLALATYLGSLK